MQCSWLGERVATANVAKVVENVLRYCTYCNYLFMTCIILLICIFLELISKLCQDATSNDRLIHHFINSPSNHQSNILSSISTFKLIENSTYISNNSFFRNKTESGWGPNAVFRFPQHGGTGGIWKKVSFLVEFYVTDVWPKYYFDERRDNFYSCLMIFLLC